jgi:hypothetical protein
MKSILGFVVALIFAVVPVIALAAENDMDLRIKLGTAASIDELSDDSSKITIGGDVSSNAQLELLYSHYFSPTTSAIIGAGFFSRTHSGSEDLGTGSGETSLDYNAQGVSVSFGVGLKPTDNVRWEGRVELGVGEGDPSLSTPGVIWHDTKSGSYTSASIILGGYYSFTKPGVELGLELGSQSFQGDWKIWNSGGYWSDFTFKGNSVAANLILGYRF